MSNLKITSPCNNICKLDDANQICIGCGRTTEEITNWIYYSEEMRTLIINILSQRLDNYKNVEQDRTPQ